MFIYFGTRCKPLPELRHIFHDILVFDLNHGIFELE